MAESGERRMLFDTRGKRKNVIRVVYAALALLMGASLFVAVGPFNLAEIIGTSNEVSAAKAADEQVERIERRLAKSPNDEQLLLTLSRAQIGAGSAATEGEGVIPVEARNDFSAGLDTWDLYLAQVGDGASPTAAQLVAGTAFALAERGSNTMGEVLSNVTTAVEAQRIAAERQPSVGSLSTLAIYEYFDGNEAAGDKAAKRATALAPSKAEAESIEKQLKQFRQRGTKFVQQAEQFSKQQAQTGQEQLQNPFGLGPPGGVTGE